MTKLEYTFKTDILFKMPFVEYPELLKRLIAELLGISLDSITKFQIRNPEMPLENLGDKFCRLDINMMVNGQLVDIEIQVDDEGDYTERVMFYWAREFSTALPAGQGYSKLPRTIIISIIDFKQFACEEFHSEFTITASSEFRERERLRAKARHDEAQALYNAELKGESKRNVEIAHNLLSMNMPLDQIVKATGLTFEEVENLRS